MTARNLRAAIVLVSMFSASTLSAGGIPEITWTGGGDGTSASVEQNWNPVQEPSRDHNVLLPGGLGGPQTIDIGGSVLEVRLLEATNHANPNPYTLTDGTIEIFLTGGNSILTRNTGGAVTVDADIVFPSVATGPRFNVEPTAPPIVVNGTITTSASSGAGAGDGGAGSGVISTTVLELTSRNLALPSSVTVNGVISDTSNRPLALTAGFAPDSENHKGTVTLTGANTYRGPTIVNGAVLEFNSIGNVDASGIASALGAPQNVADGTIRLGAIDGSSDVRVPGTLRYTGSAAAQSDRRIQLEGDGGTIAPADGAGSLTLTGDIFSNNAALDLVNLVLGGTGSHEVAGDIYESGTMVRVVKVGSGTWRLSGNNSYTGMTLNIAGRLIVDTDSLPAAGGISNGGELEFNQMTIAPYNGLIYGSGDVIKSGNSSSLTLTAANTYLGDTIITAGSIGTNSIANAGVTSPIGRGNTVRVGGVAGQAAGLVYYGPAASTNRNYVLESDGDTFISSLNNSLAVSGVVSGTNNLFEIRGQIELTGTNTYTAETSILDFSTLSVPAVTEKFVPGPLGAGETIRLIQGSTLRFTGATGSTDREFTLDHLGGSSAIDVTSGELTLIGEIVSGDSGSTGEFEKLGAGTLAIARPNGNEQFNHDTVVKAGTLLVNNTTGSGTGSGDVTVGGVASLGGTGSISGNVILEESASLAPGASTGTLSVGGDVDFLDASKLSVEVAGRDEGQFDRLNVGGTADVDGFLSVDLEDGFIPATSDEFTIVIAGTLTGGFAGLLQGERVSSGAGEEGTFFVDIDYVNDVVVLTDFQLNNSMLGDYNSNGIVDAADYTTWRDNLGTSASLPNDISPGIVDENDYTVWKNNFGNVAAGGGAGSGAASLTPGESPGANYAVPEPASVLLVVLAAVCLSVCSRRGG